MGCGAPCAELSPLARKFHLLLLENEAAPPGARLPSYRLYRQAGSAAASDQALAAGAARMEARPDFEAAMVLHHRAESEAVGVVRESVARDLLRIAAMARVRTADLVRVRQRDRVSRKELQKLLKIKDDGARSEALRRLLAVEVIPWKDLDPELTRGVTIEQKADGSVKITPPPLSAANAALKQLRQLYALDEKLALEDTIGGIVQAILDVFGDSPRLGELRERVCDLRDAATRA